MKKLLTIIFTSSVFLLQAQNGYVKIDEDSTIVGFLRNYISVKDGEHGIEVWRTKTDKNPLRIPKRAIIEYAIKKDTFKVLHQFTPFSDHGNYFELAEAKLKSKGKVNLYIIKDHDGPGTVSSHTGGGLIPAIIDESLGNPQRYQSVIYILEDKSGYLKALPSKEEELKEILMEFFPDRYITKYAEVKAKKGKITYKSVPDLVQLYNSK